MTELWRLTARQAVDLLRSGEVSPLEMVEASAARIEATDGGLNAVPTRCFERARAHARRLMAAPDRRYRGPGALHGLPLAVKDLEDVAGVRTTYGSPIWADHVPQRSDIAVERLEARGAIVMGKSNTPEFGAGGHSFNQVLGASANPWDRQRSPGGSSGGSAAALAAGQVPLATGSDLGGSLRIPASFCAVVGLRPSPGMVARGPDDACFDDLSVRGPMARNVPDAALMLDAMAGSDRCDPLARPAPPSCLDRVLRALDDGPPPLAIGYSPHLGVPPVDAEVDRICRDACRRLAGEGGELREAGLDFSDGVEAFHTLRALGFAESHEDDLRRHCDLLKPECVWNIERGLRLSVADVLRARRRRAALYRRLCAFFAECDLLALPATVLPAFPMHERYPKELAGHRFGNYVDWMLVTALVTLTSCPAISIPCGFTASGLPVGLQLVAPSHGDGELLAWAACAERLFAIADRLPIEPGGAPGRAPGPEPVPHGR